MRWILLLAVQVTLFAALPNERRQNTPSPPHLVVDSDGKISIPKALAEIFDQVHLKPENNKINTIIASIQKAWVRKPNQERWHLPYMAIEDKSALMENFRKLGMIDAVAPSSKKYDYALLLGCAIPAVKRRMSHLIRLWNEGVRFQQIVFLASDRPLDTQYETKEVLLCNLPKAMLLGPISESEPLPKTEVEVMDFYYNHCLLPPELRAIPLQIVVAKTQGVLIDSKTRPSRSDTIIAWSKYKPKPGKALAISSQPHVGYEDAVIRRILPPSFQLETVGEPALEATNPAVFLDALGRWMFVEVFEFD